MGSNKSKIFVAQISNLSPSEKSVVLMSSLLFDTDLLSEACLLIVAPFQCCRHHQVQFFIIKEIFARHWLRGDEVIQRFGCFDFLDPLRSERGILRLRANLCSEVYSPTLKFRMVKELSQMYVIWTFSLALTEEQGKNGLQWFFTPTFLNSFSSLNSRWCCQISWIIMNFFEALVGQVDNQKRFGEYSYPLVYFAAFSIRG